MRKKCFKTCQQNRYIKNDVMKDREGDERKCEEEDKCGQKERYKGGK
jgi:hypothetical protein